MVKFVHIDDSLYQEYTQKLDANNESYKKRIEAIRNSEDPVYSVDSKAKYDIHALEEERDEKDASLRKEYDEKLNELKAQAIKELALNNSVTGSADAEVTATKVTQFNFQAKTENIDVALNEFLKYLQFAMIPISH
ncbi:hypothetical protein [Salinicoccus albus]|uniref:hypothetical protein n=1 Tax=Salinicoccus albus TaxID=418756 RepID=UPI00036BC669|nr:hypothetical protein [Salinicoccus albus]